GGRGTARRANGWCDIHPSGAVPLPCVPVIEGCRGAHEKDEPASRTVVGQDMTTATTGESGCHIPPRHAIPLPGVSESPWVTSPDKDHPLPRAVVGHSMTLASRRVHQGSDIRP